MKIENLKKAVELNDTIEQVNTSINEAIAGSFYGDDDVVPSSLTVVNAQLKRGLLKLQAEIVAELTIEIEKL